MAASGGEVGHVALGLGQRRFLRAALSGLTRPTRAQASLVQARQVASDRPRGKALVKTRPWWSFTTSSVPRLRDTGAGSSTSIGTVRGQLPRRGGPPLPRPRDGRHNPGRPGDARRAYGGSRVWRSPGCAARAGRSHRSARAPGTALGARLQAVVRPVPGPEQRRPGRRSPAARPRLRISPPRAGRGIRAPYLSAAWRRSPMVVATVCRTSRSAVALPQVLQERDGCVDHRYPAGAVSRAAGAAAARSAGDGGAAGAGPVFWEIYGLGLHPATGSADQPGDTSCPPGEWFRASPGARRRGLRPGRR